MRLTTCVAACGLLALVAVASAAGLRPAADSPAARAAGAVVLGSKGFATRGAGWGDAHPSRIFNGGDPSGLVTHIHWTGWGDSLASGRGLSSIYEPRGGYYPQLVTIELQASNLGHCTAGGPLAYRRLSIRVPSHPGGRLGPWMQWSGASTICAASLASTSSAQLWTALGGTVTCGVATHPYNSPPMQLLCNAKPVPAPKANGVGDPGFVFLGSTGHPSLARLSQDSFVVTEEPVALSSGRKWSIGPISVTCTIGPRAVRCANRSHHGFTITKGSYRAF
jgi:hypothetical protein